jgi:hypothetical protein
MDRSTHAEPQGTRVIVNPGVCGFKCTIRAEKVGKGRVAVAVLDTDCEQVQKMSQMLEEINMKDLFKPITKNQILMWAEQAQCHTTCLVPFALLKAVEAEMGMALAKDAGIEFE